MQLRRLISFALSLVTAAIAVGAHAQTSAAAGTVVVLPQIADITDSTTGWVSTVFVQNPNGTPITLNVTYYTSDQAQSGATVLVCDQLSIAGNTAVTFDPGTQCHLDATYGAVHNVFGMMILEDSTSTYKTNAFYAYSRVEKPSGTIGAGNGFSLEGFPIGNFSSAPADVIGLRRTATSPNYLSNCFVDALGEQVDYQIVLRQGETGALLGTYPQSGPPVTLAPYHTTRVYNVLSAAGLTSGDYSNVRATFVNSDNSAMIGFCTVETPGTGSADFRIAKSIDARDVRQARQACYGMDACGATTPSATDPAHLNSTTSKNIHYAIFDQPDFVQCTLVSDSAAHLADLEIMLRVPGDPQTALQFDVAAQPAPYNAAPYTSGGQAATMFYVYTGEKSTQAQGATTRWYIDVSGNALNPNLATDIAAATASGGKGVPYGITCTGGNGISVPWLGTTGTANP